MSTGPYAPTDLLVGALLGFEEREPLPPAVPGETARTVLERLLLGALCRGRVGVPLLAGSGSAVMLALAADLARRHGLEPPVPLSLDFALPEMAEDERRRERLVAHLDLGDRWVRVRVGAEDLQLVGEHAQRVLLAHGLLYPANVFWVRPLVEHLGAGTLVVAHGQSEAFDFWPYAPLLDVLRGRRRPDRRVAALLVLAALPPRARARALRGRTAAPRLPWLRPAGQAAVDDAWHVPVAPVRWSRALPLLRGQRCQRVVPEAYAAVAAEFGVDTLFPYADGQLVSTVIRQTGPLGMGPEAGGVTRWLPGVLPDDLADGRDRTAYGGVFYGSLTREFGRQWSGGGLDEALVDVQALRALWTSERYDWRTSALMHLAWLHDR